jgi:hypothetical protein
MVRRERGVMPHFRELDEARIREVVAYLRAVVFQSPPSVPFQRRLREETTHDVHRPS